MIIFRQIKETTINRVNNNAKVVPMHPVKGHKFVAEVILIQSLHTNTKSWALQFSRLSFYTLNLFGENLSNTILNVVIAPELARSPVLWKVQTVVGRGWKGCLGLQNMLHGGSQVNNPEISLLTNAIRTCMDSIMIACKGAT